MEDRYDILYSGSGITIEPHFCREWECERGCYGTNPNHGYTWEDACDQIAEDFERQAAWWRQRAKPAGYERYLRADFGEAD